MQANGAGSGQEEERGRSENATGNTVSGTRAIQSADTRVATKCAGIGFGYSARAGDSDENEPLDICIDDFMWCTCAHCRPYYSS